MTNEEFQENVTRRELDTESIFFASFLAGLNLYNILNQAMINKASDRAGAHLARFAKLSNPVKEKPDTTEEFQEAVDLLVKMLGISKDVKITYTDGEPSVSIETSTCRFCPKGVGEAELNGTLCPFPALIESFTNGLHDSTVVSLYKERGKPTLTKKGNYCTFEYRIGETVKLGGKI